MMRKPSSASFLIFRLLLLIAVMSSIIIERTSSTIYERIVSAG
jgi:hypothetical protein